jgi:hypothetical protein
MVDVLPDPVIGVRGHALVEVAWRKRLDDADDLLEAEPQRGAAGKCGNRSTDLARRNQRLDHGQLAVRRPLLHRDQINLIGYCLASWLMSKEHAPMFLALRVAGGRMALPQGKGPDAFICPRLSGRLPAGF